MPAPNATLPGRGKTFLKGPSRTPGTTYGQSVDAEGTMAEFKDMDYSVRGVKTPRTGRMVTCVLARNVMGVAGLPKRTIKWQAGYFRKRFDGYVTVQAERADGVIDEWLPAAGVDDDDLCWVAIKGPSVCLTDIAALVTITAGDYVVALTAATSQATTAGRILGLVVTTNTTYAASNAMNKLGIALTTRTTGNTNADLLVELQLA